MWMESLWAFPESYSAGNSQIVYSNNGGQREGKRAQNLTIRVSFCAIIIHWVSADSNTNSVVRIFIGLSCKLWGFTVYLIAFYITLWNTIFPYQDCNNTLPLAKCLCSWDQEKLDLKIIVISTCSELTEAAKVFWKAVEGFNLRQRSGKFKHHTGNMYHKDFT